MKTNYAIIFFISLIFSCSVEEGNEMDSSSNLINPQEEMVDETTSVSDNNQLQISTYAENSSAYSISSALRVRSSASNESNGVTVYQSASMLTFSFNMEDGRFLVVEVPNTDGKVSALPNGRFKFKTHSTDPACYIMNKNYQIEYSNFCMDRKQGVFNFNVISDCIAIPSSNGGMNYYSIEPYFSASVINYVTKLNNSTFNLNSNNEIENCGNATDEISIQLKKMDGNQNTNSDTKFKLTVR